MVSTSSRLHRIVVLIWVAFFLRGAFYASILPIWEGFDDSKVSAGCSDYYGDLKAAALMFRRRMGEAADAARRAGVYPGQARDIRHQYRIDSPEW